jgi:5-methylcytosine-specific restriction protein A
MATSFSKRTYTMYSLLKKRGAVGFTLESFRAHLERSIERDSNCTYCGQVLMLKTVSADHKLPLSRGGRNLLSNVQFVCKSDNKSKGNMSDEEYRYLLARLDEMEKEFPDFPARRHVLSALRISNSFRQGAMRRAKATSVTGK